MKILHVDANHPILKQKLQQAGFVNVEDYKSSKQDIQNKIEDCHGLVIRSRFPIDAEFLAHTKQLQFIARVGAGMENIDVKTAKSRNIQLFNAPEGNRESVAEHAMAMLLSLLNKIKIANQEVQNGLWKREENRGEELMGKTVAIIGYGNTGKALAKRLSSFGVRIIFYDLISDLADEFAQEATWNEIFEQTDVLSLHVPLTDLTKNMVNQTLINQFKKPFYLLNTARGQCVCTKDLVLALQNKQIKGAGLDVLEYEKSSFEHLLQSNTNPDLDYLVNAKQVILTPHIAGWTHESKYKLANTIANKIIQAFPGIRTNSY